MILIKKFPEGKEFNNDNGKFVEVDYVYFVKIILKLHDIEWWQNGEGQMLIDCNEKTFRGLFLYSKSLNGFEIEKAIILSPKEKHDDTWFFSRSDTQNFYLVKKLA